MAGSLVVLFGYLSATQQHLDVEACYLRMHDYLTRCSLRQQHSQCHALAC